MLYKEKERMEWDPFLNILIFFIIFHKLKTVSYVDERYLICVMMRDIVFEGFSEL